MSKRIHDKKKLNQKGVTILETMIVAGLMLIVIFPLMGIYIQSVTTMYVVDKLSEAQKQANNALFFLSQDLGGAEKFISVTNTSLVCTTYRHNVVGFYRNATDNTLRRVSGTSLTGGEIKARYVTDMRFTYYSDTTYQTTLNKDLVKSLRFDVTINVPASDLTNPNALDTAGFSVSSFIWCRNITTN